MLGERDSTIKLWNLKTGQVIQTLRLQPTDGIVDTLWISSDGKRLASATTQNKLQLWDISTGRLIRTFVNENVNLNYRLPIQFSPNGQQLSTADIDHSVKLWNATNGARIVTLQGHSQGIQSVAFSPDGQTLASSSADHTVKR
jgi:WD40 repeat protein